MATQITEPTEHHHQSQRPRTPWVLLLPLALFAGALWQGNRGPDRPLGNMDMNGNPTGNAAGNSVTPRPVPTRRSDAPNPDTPVKLILFLPNENAELRREVVSDPNLKIGEMPTAPSTADSVTATHALSALFKKAGDVFPSGTEVVQVVPVTDTSEPKDVIKVELNRNFENAQHWSKGDSFALLATTAIANTVAANQNEIKDPKVQILVEGKPVETLGELDISEPIGPDKSLVTDD